MRKQKPLVIITALLAAFILLTFFGTVGTAFAQPPAQTQVPTAKPYDTWDNSLIFVLKASKNFAWLRTTPSPTADAIYTLRPGIIVVAQDIQPAGEVWDGTQWWGWVVANKQIQGWIEIDSLERLQVVPPTAPAPTATPSSPMPYNTWDNTMAFVLKDTKPFGWLRKVPSSDGAVVFTVQSRVTMTAQAKEGGGEVWDGVQWWGWIMITPKITGWIEIDSLTPKVTPTPTAEVPTATPSSPMPYNTWDNTMAFKLKAAKPFGWIRKSPSPTGAVSFTLQPNMVVIAQGLNTGGEVWDGVQWWGWVSVNDKVSGWIEIDSLEPTQLPVVTPTAVPTQTSQPTPPKASWRVGQNLLVRSNVGSAWLRASPSSDGTVIATLPPNSVVKVVGDPQFDGVQWWWQVQPQTTGTDVGWIEQKLLLG